MTENVIGTIIADAAIALHRGLGPGLLETYDEVVLVHELQERGLPAPGFPRTEARGYARVKKKGPKKGVLRPVCLRSRFFIR